eukprot:TRINITY_DN13014_c0_g1_i1.p1 TRINITY_DN13014_c0_g1~~TRINITY_DN13014_c0_g1_i1.p1  ORF type:complete len:220 (-),score=2.97 TRINITY_DN13014_c0_g1_i1:248-907(-)
MMSAPMLSRITPVESEVGLLMDGGVLDNVPTGVMRDNMGADIIVGVDVGSETVFERMDALSVGSVSGWRVLFDWLTGRATYTNVVELLLYMTVFVDAQRSMHQTKEESASDLTIAPDVASFDLLDWKPEVQQQLFQRGYQAALSALQALKRDDPTLYESFANAVEYHPRVMAPYVYNNTTNMWRRASIILSSVVGVFVLYRLRARLQGSLTRILKSILL